MEDFFNKWNSATPEEVKSRAEEMNAQLANDPNINLEEFNAELRAINAVIANQAEKRSRTTRGIVHTFGEDVLATPEYRSAFYKNLLSQKLSENEQAAYTAGLKEIERRSDYVINSTGAAAAIPTQSLNEVLSGAHGSSGILAACRHFTIPANVSIPVSTPATGAGWHVEGDNTDASRQDFTTVSFAGYELIKLFSLSVKTQKMSVKSLEAFLTQELSESITTAIADALINGNGVNMPLGLLEGVTWVADENLIEAEELIQPDDIIQGLKLLMPAYSHNVKIALSHKTLFDLMLIKNGHGEPVFMADYNSSEINRLLGYEIVLDDYLPDDVIIAGNFSFLAVNMPQGIIIESSRDSSFRRGLIDLRAMAIADCKVLAPEAFVQIKAVQANG